MITEDSFLDFKCPYCGASNSFPQTTEGRLQECFSCLESLIVPAPGNEIGRRLPFPLATPRLILRRFTASDWKDLLELAKDEKFLVYADGLALVGDEQTVREETVVDWLATDSHIKLTSPHQPFRLALELKHTGKLAGYLRFNFTDPHMFQAWFTFDLHRVHQRQGFAHEAAAALLGFCFNDLRLHRVTASLDSRNAAASRLCEKLGMRREAEFVKDYSFEGEWGNTVWYGMLKEEYRPSGPLPTAT